ncbi:MAG: hypothetical protein E7356_00350 [Clostridiales bacterium]|nr:hypothetical protein [Clostridiales bacterium]
MDNKIIRIDDDVGLDKVKSDNTLLSKLTSLMTQRKAKIILLLVLAIIAVMMIVLSYSKDEKLSSKETLSTSSYLSTLDYCEQIELRLKSIISQIDNAGDVEVMVTVDGSPEYVYASDNNSTSSSNSSGITSSSSSSSPIIVGAGASSSALILTESLPDIKGVIVVATGAGNVAVKLDILNAVSTLLGISRDKVSVLKGIK